MGNLYLKGKQVSGSVTNASAVNCLGKDGQPSTVQREFDNLYAGGITDEWKLGCEAQGRIDELSQSQFTFTFPFKELLIVEKIGYENSYGMGFLTEIRYVPSFIIPYFFKDDGSYDFNSSVIQLQHPTEMAADIWPFISIAYIWQEGMYWTWYSLSSSDIPEEGLPSVDIKVYYK